MNTLIIKKIFPLVTLLFLIFTGCTPKNQQSKNYQSLENMEVVGSGEFGPMDWNQSLSKIISLKNTSSSSVSISPTIEGANSASFILVSSRGCSSVAPQAVCSIKLMVSARGLVAGDHLASLNLGSLGSLPLTATINATPGPIIEIQVDGSESSSAEFIVQGRNKVTKIIALRNIGPVTMPALSVSKNLSDVSIVANSCGILPPSKMCFIKLSVSGKNTAASQSGSLSVGSLLSVNLLINSSVVTEAPSLTSSDSEIDLGDFTATGQKVVEILAFTNTGNVPGNLELQGLPAGYSVISSTCGNVVPKGKCYLKLQYTNQETSMGGHSDSLSLGSSNVVVNHNIVSSKPLARINVLSKDNVHQQECESIQVSLEDSDFQPFVKSSDVSLSVSGLSSFFEDSNCQNNLSSLSIPKLTSQKTIYIKNLSLGNHNIVVSSGDVQSSKSIFVYEDLILNPVAASLIISTPQQFTVSGGKSPFNYSVLSGVGNISSSGLYSSAGAGSAVVRVIDAVGQMATANILVANPLSLSSSALNQIVSTQQTPVATGGFSPYSYSIVSGGGSINSSSGLFTAPSTPSMVVIRVVDSLNHQAEISINVVSVLAITPLSSSITTSNSQTFSGVGGLAPYTFSVISGVGSISNGVYSSNQAGTAIIQVTDALGQTAQTGITVNSNLSILAGTCNYNIPEYASCTVTASGGVGSRSFSVNQGTINSSSGVFKGQCVNNLGSSIVTVTDQYSNTAQITLNYPCVYASCNQIRAEGYGLANADYWIDLDQLGGGADPFKMYCDVTNSAGGGLSLISSGGSVCGNTNYTSKSEISFNGNCGYLPESKVRSLSQTAIEVTLRAGASHTSFDEAKSKGTVTLNALKTGGNWNPGGSSGNFTEFVNTIGTAWAWNYSCANLYVSSWPNMYQSCNNGNGVHWLSATSGFVGQSKTSGASVASSTWLLNKYLKYPLSCLDAKNKGALNQEGNPGSGLYTVDPDGFGFGQAAVTVYCDQVTDGGGWTLVSYAGTIPASGKKSGATGSTTAFMPLFHVYGVIDNNSFTSKTSWSRFDIFKPLASATSRFLARRTSVPAKMISWSLVSASYWGGTNSTLPAGTQTALRMTNTGESGWANKSNAFFTTASSGDTGYPGISWNTTTYENTDNTGSYTTGLSRRSLLYWVSVDYESIYGAQWFHATPLSLAPSTGASNTVQDVEFYFRE